MSAPFIDDAGFHALGLNGWLALLTSQYQSIYGAEADLGSDSPDGQWLGVLAGDFADLEELLQQVYSGRAPAGAVGAGLSRLVRLNGITRKPAQFSSAPIRLTGTPGTIIPIHSLIGSASDPTIPAFQTRAAYTIGGGGTITGFADCTVAGPVNVASGDLTQIQTVISGWTAVTNTSAATPGTFLETDAALRTRRASATALPSQSMLDGLEAALLNLAGVTDARVYENTTNVVNEKGDPGHSIHAIVDGGSDSDIANAIWVKASMGVTRVGGHSLNVTDSQGNPQTQKWDRPADENVYIEVALSRTVDSIAKGKIQDALVAYGTASSRIGENVFWADLFTPINAIGLTGAPGLPSILSIKLGSAPSPTDQADLVVPFNARPRYDASQISVLP